MLIREAVAVFETEREMLEVVEELESAGVDRSEVSVLPSVDDVERQIGHPLKSVKETEDDPEIGRAIPIDSASYGAAQGVLIGIPTYLGAISMVIAGAVVGQSLVAITVLVAVGGALGALLGYFLANWLQRAHERQIEEQISRGGLVLWIHIRDKSREKNVTEILSHHVAHDVHIHTIAA